MIYLQSIVTIIVCCLAWYLARLSQNTDLKRQEVRKINRLIFNLLDLKYWVDKEIDLDQQLSTFLDEYEKEVLKHAPNITKDQFNGVRTILTEIIKQQILNQSRLADIEVIIEEIIKELAEVDPVFAFELTGKYQISVNLSRIKDFINKIDSLPENGMISETIVNQLFRPKMMKDLQMELRINIPRIAKKADKKTYKSVKILPNTETIVIDKKEIQQFLSELVPKLINLIEPAT